MRYLPVVVLVGLVVYTVLDVLRSTAEERSGLARPAWVALIVLLPLAGSIIWLVVRQRARARGAGGAPGGGGGGGSRPGPFPRGPRRPSGPVAPDDDPEFLWRLDQQQRRARGAREAGETPPGTPTDAEGDSPGTARP